MKKTVRTKVFAAVMAAVAAISVGTAAIAVTASAVSDNTSASQAENSTVITNRTTGNTFTLPIRGEDWNYYADSLNVKISCDFDYNHNICNFKFTAVKPGITNAVLKTQNKYGSWDNTPVRIVANNDLTMQIVQSGDAYETEKSYTEEAAKPVKTTTSSADTRETKQTSTKASTKELSVPGENWTYYIDSLNIKVTCDFDYSSSICNFKLTAVKPGTTNAVLKTQRKDGKWDNLPVRVVVNDDMTMTITQTGSTYVTAHSYSE